MIPPAWAVLVRAAVLARDSGAAEIGIDDLLAALESSLSASESPAPTANGQFLPVPKYEVPLSTAAAAAISSVPNLDTASVEELQAVLLRSR